MSIRSSTRRHTWIPRTIRVGPTQTDFIVKLLPASSEVHKIVFALVDELTDVSKLNYSMPEWTRSFISDMIVASVAADMTRLSYMPVRSIKYKTT